MGDNPESLETLDLLPIDSNVWQQRLTALKQDIINIFAEENVFFVNITTPMMLEESFAHGYISGNNMMKQVFQTCKEFLCDSTISAESFLQSIDQIHSILLNELNIIQRWKSKIQRIYWNQELEANSMEPVDQFLHRLEKEQVMISQLEINIQGIDKLIDLVKNWINTKSLNQQEQYQFLNTELHLLCGALSAHYNDPVLQPEFPSNLIDLIDLLFESKNTRALGKNFFFYLGHKYVDEQTE